MENPPLWAMLVFQVSVFCEPQELSGGALVTSHGHSMSMSMVSTQPLKIPKSKTPGCPFW